MTEAEWLVSDRPDEMLKVITDGGMWPVIEHGITTSKASERKLRLLIEAFRMNADPSKTWQPLDVIPLDEMALWWAQGGPGWKRELPDNKKALLLRLIFGNPFRPVSLPYYSPRFPNPVWYRPGDPVTLDEDAAVPWLTPDVLAIAQSIYDNRDASGFGPLWDTLETAQCDNEEIRRALTWKQRCPKCLGSGNCKSCANWPDFMQIGPGDCSQCGGNGICQPCHGAGWRPMPGKPFMVRGMWVVDLILGKE